MIPLLLPYALALALVALVVMIRGLVQWARLAEQERDEADRLLEREMETTKALRAENRRLRAREWELSHLQYMDIQQICGEVVDL